MNNDDDDYDDYVGLKPCGPAPNCFCSTIPAMENDPDHMIPAWIWPSKMDISTAFAELYDTLQSYPPGQNGIDGGGYEIQVYDPTKGYIYVIYEAWKNGYYDDVEFAASSGMMMTPTPPPTTTTSTITSTASVGARVVHVRSSSRIGYLDYGVNAKRLNWIAQVLRNKGWIAEGVDYSSHRGYVIENEL